MDDVIWCDTDVLFNSDVRELTGNFDVAVATRPDGENISKSYRRLYPYCSLVIVKDRTFWTDCYKRMLKYRKKDGWTNSMGAQACVIDSGKYKVRFLDGNIYNQKKFEYSSEVKVYHFRVTDKNRISPFYKEYWQ